MELWGAALYGDPCGGCGFDWSIDAADAVALVRSVPDRYFALLDGVPGATRHPDLGWTVAGYVAHVGDNLRSWAERLAGAALYGECEVAGYGRELLGHSRNYDQVSLGGALWSLHHAVRDWHDAVVLAAPRGVVLTHAERGEQAVDDVVRNNAHDAAHHEWELRRTLAAHERVAAR